MSTLALDGILVVIILLNFRLVGTGRLRAAIQCVAFQGALLGMIPLLVQGFGLRVVSIAVATIVLKAMVIPALLMRAMRSQRIHREIEPLISQTASLVIVALGSGLALAFAQSLPVRASDAVGLLIPASLSTTLTGAVILTTRVKAITQVVGYLVLENGIFIFGTLLLEPLPFLVEIGVLLDLFVAVFVMAIMINHISREFDSIHTDRLSALRE